jgi:hypothetical protein
LSAPSQDGVLTAAVSDGSQLTVVLTNGVDKLTTFRALSPSLPTWVVEETPGQPLRETTAVAWIEETDQGGLRVGLGQAGSWGFLDGQAAVAPLLGAMASSDGTIQVLRPEAPPPGMSIIELQPQSLEASPILYWGGYRDGAELVEAWWIAPPDAQAPPMGVMRAWPTRTNPNLTGEDLNPTLTGGLILLPELLDLNPVVDGNPAIISQVRLPFPLQVRGMLVAKLDYRLLGIERRFQVVAFGDSFGAGEGAPFLPANETCPESEGPTAFGACGIGVDWTDQKSLEPDAQWCHRSPLAGTSRAMERVRAEFPDITFVFRSFACTGAVLDNLNDSGQVVEDDFNLDWVDATDNLRFSGRQTPQALAAREMLLNEGWPGRLDAVTISLGGNDAGFADLMAIAIKRFRDEVLQRKYEELFNPTVDDLPRRMREEVAELVDPAGPLKDWRPTRESVLWTTYPDMLHDGAGATCDTFVSDNTSAWGDPGLEVFKAWGPEEIDVFDQVFRDLTDAIREGASSAGATPVDVGQVPGHGICADYTDKWVNGNEAGWVAEGFNTPSTSTLAIVAGGVEEIELIKVSMGAMHPNANGYEGWYAPPVAEQLSHLVTAKFYGVDVEVDITDASRVSPRAGAWQIAFSMDDTPFIDRYAWTVYDETTGETLMTGEADELSASTDVPADTRYCVRARGLASVGSSPGSEDGPATCWGTYVPAAPEIAAIYPVCAAGECESGDGAVGARILLRPSTWATRYQFQQPSSVVGRDAPTTRAPTPALVEVYVPLEAPLGAEAYDLKLRSCNHSVCGSWKSYGDLRGLWDRP